MQSILSLFVCVDLIIIDDILSIASNSYDTTTTYNIITDHCTTVYVRSTTRINPSLSFTQAPTWTCHKPKKKKLLNRFVYRVCLCYQFTWDYGVVVAYILRYSINDSRLRFADLRILSRCNPITKWLRCAITYKSYKFPFIFLLFIISVPWLLSVPLLLYVPWLPKPRSCLIIESRLQAPISISILHRKSYH